MNLFRAWSPKVWLSLICVCVFIIGLAVMWAAPADRSVWVLILVLACLILLLAVTWWRLDQSHLGAAPVQLARATHLLAQGQHEQAHGVLGQGGQGAWGDLATVVTNLQTAQTRHDERTWRDQGLSLIHETVRHDHTPQALSDLVSQTLIQGAGDKVAADDTIVVHGTYPYLVIRHGDNVVGLRRSSEQ